MSYPSMPMRAPIATWMPGRAIAASRSSTSAGRVEKADDLGARRQRDAQPLAHRLGLPAIGHQLKGADSPGALARQPIEHLAGRILRTVVDEQQRGVGAAVDESEQRSRVEASGFVVA